MAPLARTTTSATVATRENARAARAGSGESAPRSPRSSQASPPTQAPTAIMWTHCTATFSEGSPPVPAAWPPRACASMATAAVTPIAIKAARPGQKSKTMTATAQRTSAAPSQSRD